MGLLNFHSPAEGVLPLLVMQTVMSVAMFKNFIRSMLQVVGAVAVDKSCPDDDAKCLRAKRVSVMRYGCKVQGCDDLFIESCSVCLCSFGEEEQVSELNSCKHFFHKVCLDKWFDAYHHVTCPICRSVV